MPSDVQLCNMALARVNQGSIASLTESSRAAELCSAFLDILKDQILREFAWPFARRRVALALTANTSSTWAYCYAYPSDCLTALRLVIPGLQKPRNDQAPPYEIGGNGAQKVIWTDLPEAELEYTARVTDLDQTDPLFVNALGWLLAAEVATPLTGKHDVADLCRRGYMLAVSQAAAAGLNEQHYGEPPDGEFLASRGVVPSGYPYA